METFEAISPKVKGEVKGEERTIREKIEELAVVFYSNLKISTIAQIEKILQQRKHQEMSREGDLGNAIHAIHKHFKPTAFDLVEIVLVLVAINNYETLRSKQYNTEKLKQLLHIIGQKQEIITGFICPEKLENTIQKLIRDTNRLSHDEELQEIKFEIWKMNFLIKNYEYTLPRVVDTKKIEQEMGVDKDHIFQQMKKKFIHDYL